MSGIGTGLNTGGTRFAIAQALLAKFDGIMPWATKSLRFRWIDQVLPPERPALFITSGAERRVQGDESTPPMVTIEYTVFVYTYIAPDGDVLALQTMSDVLDKFDKALAPSPLEAFKQTLGQLVSHCWIEGTTRMVPGDLDGNGLAIIPINVLIPS